MEKQDRPTATSRKQFWLEHLERCRESGKPLKAYAEQNGLSVGTFYSYSKRFKGKETGRFARVSSSSRAAHSPVPCRIVLPNGVAVELGIGSEAIGTVLAMAAKLP